MPRQHSVSHEDDCGKNWKKSSNYFFAGFWVKFSPSLSKKLQLTCREYILRSQRSFWLEHLIFFTFWFSNRRKFNFEQQFRCSVVSSAFYVSQAPFWVEHFGKTYNIEKKSNRKYSLGLPEQHYTCIAEIFWPVHLKNFVSSC